MILTCNAGSNSLKCALYDAGTLIPRFVYDADRIHEQPARASLKDGSGTVLWEDNIASGHEAALDIFLEQRGGQGADIADIKAAGHRIVHGGTVFDGPAILDEKSLATLRAFEKLAPSHQPLNLALVDRLAARLPDMPQIGCFDTAFHRTQPPVATRCGLPHELAEREGLVGYGFHGLSYEYITSNLNDLAGITAAKQRLVIAHLGSGASMCAVKDGRSIATTMGFSPLDGLLMGTRPGSLDPGIILHLLRSADMSVTELEKLLYKKSGLRGVSGISNDMRDLRSSDDPAARAAIELFCYKAARHMGGLITVLGGLDVLVFTGGMGARDQAVRRDICAYLAWLGLALDERANQRNNSRISALDSPVTVLALPTDEEYVIAGHVRDLLSKEGDKQL